MPPTSTESILSPWPVTVAQHRWPTDLRALADLDLLPEPDLAVPGQVDGQRAGAAGVWIVLLCLSCLATVAIGAMLRRTLSLEQDQVQPGRSRR